LQNIGPFIGLFFERDLLFKEPTNRNFKEPTNRSHPIVHPLHTDKSGCICTYIEKERERDLCMRVCMCVCVCVCMCVCMMY